VSDRNLPASPRRLALARKAGAVAHAPALTTAAAWAGALLALVALGPQIAAALREGLRRGLVHAGAPSLEPLPARAPALAALVGESVAGALAIAAPVLIGGAVLALGVHLAQTRGLWIPHRRLRGAPLPPNDLATRARGSLWATAKGGALAAAGLGSLVAALPVLAAALSLESAALLPLIAAALSSAGIALVATWVALGALELIGRTLALAAAARMTPAEQREELRESGGAGRLVRGAARRASDDERELLAAATLLVAGDGACAAVAWHPRRSPAPAIVLTRSGRGVELVLSLARRDRLPIRRAPSLAAQLAAAGPGEVPRALWTQLADLVARAY
jgi:flagellar biosynthesis protein FlhB